MIVFTTVLEIDGNQVLYSVYKNRSLAFLNPTTTRQAPILYASYENAAWKNKRNRRHPVDAAGVKRNWFG